MLILGNMNLEKIVLPFYKLILAYGQLIIIPQQQNRFSEPDEDNSDGNDDDEGNDDDNVTIICHHNHDQNEKPGFKGGFPSDNVSGQIPCITQPFPLHCDARPLISHGNDLGTYNS